MKETDRSYRWQPELRRRSGSPEETADVARELLPLLNAGESLALIGPLGAGKTTFVRALMHALGYIRPVRSPSFTLVHRYPTDPPVVHVDLYRLKDAAELTALNLEEEAEGALLIVEWGERFSDAWGPPDRRLTITPLPGQDDHPAAQPGGNDTGEFERLIVLERRLGG
ncbi:tRNA (adenosine(37)-N6)-threonylcarbamoyltransferase complex ATPase subunit type 1 TsaE [bacterium]|nr:tRNA (adenosine(37)-N6)-threonylcarbamoyltransferase complex ATPase subunit type 1 TsaE [bacterium]